MKTTFVDASKLNEVFAGLKFNITTMKVVLDNGTEVDKQRFKILFGGLTYSLDENNEHVTRNAWKAFTRNHNFRPEIIT